MERAFTEILSRIFETDFEIIIFAKISESGGDFSGGECLLFLFYPTSEVANYSLVGKTDHGLDFSEDWVFF